ncbi:MAG TPA: dienelactone hydrolase family protein [Phototrophicaceae bacterium]|nr:dienelactone hydrolase family protein [Phototrophicaceae bacterium]
MALVNQDVQIAGGTAGLSGYLSAPEGASKLPALVVIHEAYGLNDNIHAITRRFAEQGYVSLAVDLFAGRNPMVCMARFMGGMIFNSLHNAAINDLHMSLSYLQSLPEVDGARVGAVGFCMGGSFAIAWACTDDRLKAIAPFYAMNPRPLAAVERLCPVVGSYPGDDFTAGAGRKLDVALDGYKIEHDIKIYPDSTHSFMSHPERKPGNVPAEEDSWTRMLAFFQQKLG